MSIVATLLDKARARKGIASDNALAQHLGTNRQVVSQWRHGDSYPSEDNIAELAEMAGDDPVQWLVAVKAVRSEGKARKAWTALAKRLAAVTAGIGVIALAYFQGDVPGALMALVPVAVTDPLYIMRNLLLAWPHWRQPQSCSRRPRF